MVRTYRDFSLKRIIEDDMDFDLAVFMSGKTVLSYEGLTLWQKPGVQHVVFEQPISSTKRDEIRDEEPFFFVGIAGVCNQRDVHQSTAYYARKRASCYRTIWLEVVTSRGMKGWICGSHLSPTPPVRFGIQKADFVFRRMLEQTFDSKGAILRERDTDN